MGTAANERKISVSAQAGFCSVKKLGALLLPNGTVTGLHVPQYISGQYMVGCRYPFIHLGGEEQCGAKFLVKAMKQHDNCRQCQTQVIQEILT